MSKHLVVVVDWYGPYTYAEAVSVVKSEFCDGLYVGIGKQKHQKRKSEIQYVGIAQKFLQTRVNNYHHKLGLITRDKTIWLGEIGSHGLAGKRAGKIDTLLDLAEWALVYFLQPSLNNKKKKRPPKRDITLLNRWWKKDYSREYVRYVRRPHASWPDLIEYLGPGTNAKLVWFRNPKRVPIV